VGGGGAVGVGTGDAVGGVGALVGGATQPQASPHVAGYTDHPRMIPYLEKVPKNGGKSSVDQL